MKCIPYIVAASLSVLPAVAAAQGVDPAKPDTIVELLKANGYKALLEADGEGDPVIRSAAGGTNFNVYFYGCNSGNRDCDGINLSVGFDLKAGASLASMNEWNASQLVGQAYLDDEQDPHLDEYVSAKGGLPVETFLGVLAQWDEALGDFEDHIGW